MNRYPLWVYVTIAVALVLGALYTLPNFFGEAPAVQVSPARATLKADTAVLGRVEDALKKAGIQPTGIFLDLAGVKVRLADTDTQLKAKDLIEPGAQSRRGEPLLHGCAQPPAEFSPLARGDPTRSRCTSAWICAAACISCCRWTCSAAVAKRAESLAGDMRSQLRDKNVRHAGIAREGNNIVDRASATPRPATRRARSSSSSFPTCTLADAGSGSELRLIASIRPEAQKRTQELALKQNIQTLHNRINELGVAEPVIQQQGADRVVVQLPACRIPPRPKEILGRTATLEVRMVDEDNMNPAALAAAQRGQVPFGDEFYIERDGAAAPGAQAGRADRRPAHRRAARVRQPDARARGSPDARRHRRAASSGSTRARTSASAWRSCSSRKARAKWSRRR